MILYLLHILSVEYECPTDLSQPTTFHSLPTNTYDNNENNVAPTTLECAGNINNLSNIIQTVSVVTDVSEEPEQYGNNMVSEKLEEDMEIVKYHGKSLLHL